MSSELSERRSYRKSLVLAVLSEACMTSDSQDVQELCWSVSMEWRAFEWLATQRLIRGPRLTT